MRQVARHALAGLWLLSGCLGERVRILEERDRAREVQLAEAKITLDRISRQHENDMRTLSSETYCKSGKVAAFVTELKNGNPEVCSTASVANALFFMKSQAYGIVYMEPRIGIASMRPARRGQISELVEPEKIHASSRLVVLVQPQQETEEGQRRALELGREFVVEVLRKALPPPREPRPSDPPGTSAREVPILGPFLLPCKLRGEVLKQYTRAIDHPIPGEPSEGKPTVRVWVFKTDC